MNIEKIIIGNSDYTRKEMESGTDSWTIGSSSNHFLSVIKHYEKLGFTVKFETSIWRKLFGIGIYKVIAYK